MMVATRFLRTPTPPAAAGVLRPTGSVPKVKLAPPTSALRLSAIDRPIADSEDILKARLVHSRKRKHHVVVGEVPASLLPGDHLCGCIAIGLTPGKEKLRSAP